MKLEVEKELEQIHKKIQKWHNEEELYPEGLLFEIDEIVQNILGPGGLIEVQIICGDCNARFDFTNLKREHNALICPKCEGDSDKFSLIMNKIQTSEEGKIIESESRNKYRVFKWKELGNRKIIALEKELIE